MSITSSKVPRGTHKKTIIIVSKNELIDNDAETVDDKFEETKNIKETNDQIVNVSGKIDNDYIEKTVNLLKNNNVEEIMKRNNSKKLISTFKDADKDANDPSETGLYKTSKVPNKKANEDTKLMPGSIQPSDKPAFDNNEIFSEEDVNDIYTGGNLQPNGNHNTIENSKEKLVNYETLENKVTDGENTLIVKIIPTMKFNHLVNYNVNMYNNSNALNNINNINNNANANNNNYNNTNNVINHICNYFEENRKTIEVNDYNSCLICEKIFSQKYLETGETCNHYICKKCIKNYYEDKIEQGEKEFKCADYTCKSKFNLDIIKSLVSKQHYKLIKSDKFYNLKLGLNIENKLNNQIKLYSQKHVLDINSNENFYFFNKAKIQFCPKCLEQSLFGKNNSHFVKCLNCYHCICKYCMKDYDESHLDLTAQEHCKVYFRAEEEKEENKKDNFFISFLFQLFLIISGYLAIYCAAFIYIEEFFIFLFCCCHSKNTEKINVIIYIFILLISIALFLCSVPILVLLLPYFPVFNTIFYI